MEDPTAYRESNFGISRCVVAVQRFVLVKRGRKGRLSGMVGDNLI